MRHDIEEIPITFGPEYSLDPMVGAPELNAKTFEYEDRDDGTVFYVHDQHGKIGLGLVRNKNIDLIVRAKRIFDHGNRIWHGRK